jgi:hypothetical protein
MLSAVPERAETFDRFRVVRHNPQSRMSLAELLAEQAMALPPDERKKLGAKLLASVGSEERPSRRRAGSAAGRVHMTPDFDAPLEDFSDYS